MKSEPPKTVNAYSEWIVDERKCLSMKEICRLRDGARKAKSEGIKKHRFAQIRHWFMVELGLNSGLRVGEMATLRHRDLLIDETRSSIVVLGKGNKKRLVWISSGFKRICQDYIEYKNKFGYNVGQESFLLNNVAGNRISRRALQKAFKILLGNAGVSNHYYIHCLRHTYTTFLLKASDYNYRFVQQQLGHASIRTTQVYATVVEVDGKIALEKLYR